MLEISGRSLVSLVSIVSIVVVAVLVVVLVTVVVIVIVVVVVLAVVVAVLVVVAVAVVVVVVVVVIVAVAVEVIAVIVGSGGITGGYSYRSYRYGSCGSYRDSDSNSAISLLPFDEDIRLCVLLPFFLYSLHSILQCCFLDVQDLHMSPSRDRNGSLARL